MVARSEKYPLKTTRRMFNPSIEEKKSVDSFYINVKGIFLENKHSIFPHFSISFNIFRGRLMLVIDKVNSS
jgi:hypothetical protein